MLIHTYIHIYIDTYALLFQTEKREYNSGATSHIIYESAILHMNESCHVSMSCVTPIFRTEEGGYNCVIVRT